jgi:hypothetical protein
VQTLSQKSAFQHCVILHLFSSAILINLLPFPPMNSIRPLPHSTSMRPRHNWMSLVANKTLFDITIPGSHHSASGTISIARPSHLICRRHAQCQSLTVLEQLRSGIRCLDVRLRLGSDGVIRASHSNRVSSVELEFLFMSMEDVVGEIVRFLDGNRTEVVFLKIRMDFRATDLGNKWQLVYNMLQPLHSKMLPYSQRMRTIGDITGAGHHICVVCGQLRHAYGDSFWPWEFFEGSWDVTGSCKWQDLHTRLRAYVNSHHVVNDGSRIQYLQGEITQRLSTAVMGSLRSDAERANAVLLDLLQDAWIGTPLQIVTQDFCNDVVIEALVSRNMAVAPLDDLFRCRGSAVKSPDEFRSCEFLTSNDCRYVAVFADSGVLTIATSDNVLCHSISFSSSATSPGEYSLRLSASETLLCALQSDVIWKAERDYSLPSISSILSKLSPSHCCRPTHSQFQLALLLTDDGELHVERHHEDGHITVEWKTGNRLVKPR